MTCARGGKFSARTRFDQACEGAVPSPGPERAADPTDGAVTRTEPFDRWRNARDRPFRPRERVKSASRTAIRGD